MAIGQNSLARKIERYNRLVDKATGREIVYLDFYKAPDKKNLSYYWLFKWQD